MFPGTPFSYSPRQGQRYDLPRCNPAQINSILFMSLLPSVPSFELTTLVGGRNVFDNGETHNKVF